MTDPRGPRDRPDGDPTDATRYAVEPPPAPDDPDAWYAPDVRAQYEVHPGVVATVSDRDGEGFRYEVREPRLTPDERATLDAVKEHFADASLGRPLTREGTRERMRSGFDRKYRRAIDRLVEAGPAARRRLDYHALRDLKCLGELTPLALDDRIESADAGAGGDDRPDLPGETPDRTLVGNTDVTVIDPDAGAGDATGDDPTDGPTGEADADDGTGGATGDPEGEEPADPPPVDRLVVHTDDYAPAVTDLPADPEYIERFVAERLDSYRVPFRGFEVPVVVYRDNLLGADPFAAKYAVLEPDLLPGDRDLIAECKERIWEGNVEGVVDDRGAYVRERARRFFSRQLTARNTKAWAEAAAHRVRSALADHGVGVPPVDDRYAEDRLADLVYYVLRDFVGEGKLTVPVRDPNLEDIEANRVGERVKVVPRDSIAHDGRMPTNLTFEDESEFTNVVTQLAAADGTELDASNPSAKVNLRPEEVDDDVTIRCAVALPVISESGPHVSIRKQAPDAMTPVDLLERESLSTDLVALLWQVYEHHGVVLFSGPTGVGKTTLMNAHMPFVPFGDRPISIDEGSREVRLPHETGVSLTTREHESDHKRVSMADLMTECNYLNPDVEVIAEINTPASFQTFAESLNTGHGVIGTTHADDVETLVNRVVEQGLPTYLLRELDLVVFPRHVDGERYVGEVVEFLAEPEYRELEGDGERGTIRKDDTTIYWNTVARRTPGGEFRFNYDPSRAGSAPAAAATDGGPGAGAGTGGGPEAGTDGSGAGIRFFNRLADRTDRTVAEVEAEFRRKHRYVRYLQREGVDDFGELYDFLADLRTDEAATVERVRLESEADRTGGGR